jgi:hypothetical protein
MLSDFNINSLHEMPAAKDAIVMLLNIVENVKQENQLLKKEIQCLKDEINRLKKEQGKPEIKPNKPDDDKCRNSTNHSSEKERSKKKKKKWKKKSKNDRIVINET